MKRLLFCVPFMMMLSACADEDKSVSVENKPSATASAVAAKPAPSLCDIDENSIAGIPLGTGLDQVRQLFPNAAITPLQDSEGTEFHSIKLNPDVEVIAYTEDMGDNNQPVISYMETRSAACKTPEGVHPQMLVNDVVKQYGAVEQVMLTEVENRQTIEFAAQPPEYTIRIDDTGIFDEKDKSYPQISTAYQDNAKVLSIAIMDMPDEDSPEPENASAAK